MAPLVPLTIWATPLLPLPACVSVGQFTVDPESSFHTAGLAALRNLVKFSVVPEPSDRWATTIGVDGSLAPGLSAAIALSFQVLTSRWKILAMVSGDSCRLSTPVTLYETVIGAAIVGKYMNGPLYFDASSGFTRPSEPAQSTTPVWRSVRPLPEPPPP